MTRGNEPVSILVADDDGVARTLLRATLQRWGYDVRVARDGLEARDHLESDSPPCLAILDWMMPGIDGPELCRRVRSRAGPYTYLLLLTARTAKADLVSGLDAGADDYIQKPFDHSELQARLRVGQRIVSLEEELRLRASRDSLTGLWSRGALLDLLPREAARSRRARTTLALAMADLDHFKRVNDTWGHLAGDAVLRECGRRMQACVRPYDLVGRYGGEEVLLVLPQCDAQSAQIVAERVRATVGATPVQWGDVRIGVSVSIGLTLLSEDAEITSALERADAALYRAKAAGRNQVVFSWRAGDTTGE